MATLSSVFTHVTNQNSVKSQNPKMFYSVHRHLIPADALITVGFIYFSVSEVTDAQHEVFNECESSSSCSEGLIWQRVES